MSQAEPATSPKVVIVGPCASGKSTLAAGLRGHGYDVAVCSQEHSEIATLWRHSEPDILIALDVDLETIRLRRGGEWPESIFLAQLERLAPAHASADLVIDSVSTNVGDVLAAALHYLEHHRTSSSKEHGIE